MYSLFIPPAHPADYRTVNQELVDMAHDVSNRQNKYGANYPFKVMLYEYEK